MLRGSERNWGEGAAGEMARQEPCGPAWPESWWANRNVEHGPVPQRVDKFSFLIFPTTPWP